VERGRTASSLRRVLFGDASVRAIEVVAPPGARATDEKHQPHDGIVLPLGGAFALHAHARPRVVGTPNHALLISRDTLYRFGGGRCLVLDWPAESLAELAPGAVRNRGLGGAHGVDRGLLPPALLLERARLAYRLRIGDVDALEIEETSIRLLDAALAGAAREAPGTSGAPARDRSRGVQRVQRVQEAIASDPTFPWTLRRLARIAGLSPGRLSHLFRVEAGLPMYAFVIRSRLAAALESVLEGDADLARLAVDAGFAHHSHFTARFRQVFGATPSDVRAGRRALRVRDPMRIATAGRATAA
jgi:AraC-like DNA-binding protein